MRATLVFAVFLTACDDSAYEEAQAALDRLRAESLAATIAPDCNNATGGGACGLLADERGSSEFGTRFVTERCGGQADNACIELLKEENMQALRSRYYKATASDVMDRCRQTDCTNWRIFELQWLGSHNDAVHAAFVQGKDEIEAQLAERRRANAQRRRRVARAISAGASAFSAGMQSAPAPRTTPSGGCTSDYSCGYGMRCVKAAYATSGFCAQEVNGYGQPTYAPPSPSSWQPGKAQCQFDTECAIGFRCVSNHCVK